MTKTRKGTLLAMLAASFMTAAVGTPAAQAQNFKLLHQFAETDGIAPQGTLVRDSAGNLYGTASQGGSSNQVGCFTCGVVFKLDTAGTLTVLHYFTGGADGSAPWRV